MAKTVAIARFCDDIARSPIDSEVTHSGTNGFEPGELSFKNNLINPFLIICCFADYKGPSFI